MDARARLQPVVADRAASAASEASCGAPLVADDWLAAMERMERFASADYADPVLPAPEAPAHGKKPWDLHVVTEPPLRTPSATARRAASVPIFSSPITATTASAPCLSPKPTRPSLVVFHTASQSSFASSATATAQSPLNHARRMSVDVVDTFEGECCAQATRGGWDPPPDFFCEIEQADGFSRPVLFLHPESRGGRPRQRDGSPSDRRGKRRRSILASGTYYVDDDSDDGGYTSRLTYDEYDSDEVSSDADDTAAEVDPIGAFRGLEPLLVMLQLRPHEHVVIRSRFLGPGLEHSAGEGNESHEHHGIFEIEGEQLHAGPHQHGDSGVAPARETEWWCVGFAVADPSKEGVYPLRALKGFDK